MEKLSLPLPVLMALPLLYYSPFHKKLISPSLLNLTIAKYAVRCLFSLDVTEIPNSCRSIVLPMDVYLVLVLNVFPSFIWIYISLSREPMPTHSNVSVEFRFCDSDPYSTGERIQVSSTVEDSSWAGGTRGCQDYAQSSCGVLPYQCGGTISSCCHFIFSTIMTNCIKCT